MLLCGLPKIIFLVLPYIEMGYNKIKISNTVHGDGGLIFNAL